MKNLYLNMPQFKAETEKCLQCPSKPCQKACPAQVSPKDFIAAAKIGDINQAAELIAEQNAMGEICGLICPDSFCMRACVRAQIDFSIRIPALQATIMQKARQNNLPTMQNNVANGKKVAVIGAGPAGFGAIAALLKKGYAVTVFEKENVCGGALNLIPEARLPREIIAYEWQRLKQNPLLKAEFKTNITEYEKLLQQGFAGVVVATGAPHLRTLGIEGENLALAYDEYLAKPQQYAADGHVAVVGGGAVAVDCALTAAKQGAKHVEMFVRRRIGDMRITAAERQSLLDNGIDITTMTRPLKIEKHENGLALYTVKTEFNAEGCLQDVENTQTCRGGFAYVVLALGSTGAENMPRNPLILYAGDVVSGGTTAVQALASGKKAAEELAAKIA